jgi:hypothetical protein
MNDDIDLNSPELAPLRGVLARAFIANKASMGMADVDDRWIIEHVNDICLVLVKLTEHAVAIDDRPWLRRHLWWRLLAHQLSNELPTAQLDGLLARYRGRTDQRFAR